MIFLDNASTTRLSGRAAENLLHYSTTDFYNPSASYYAGFKNAKEIMETKELLAKHLNVKFNNNIIFTSSATEATNLAIFGSVRTSWKKAVFSAGEHPSVYNSALQLKARGIEVVFVDLDKNGAIDLNKLEAALDEDVNFISIMHVSNETGAVNNLEKIAEIKAKKCPKAIFHVDGVQAFGKVATNLEILKPDFYTISAHKFHGPKGLGALYVKNPAKLMPIIHGGGQEYNLRSGTENLPAIMALKGALEECDVWHNQKLLKTLGVYFKTELKSRLSTEIPLKILEGEDFAPHIISISFVGLKGQVLQNMCDQKGLMISTGSACSSKKMGNRVLENIGYSKDEVLGNVRISFSRYTSKEDALEGAKILAECANELWRNTR